MCRLHPFLNKVMNKIVKCVMTMIGVGAVEISLLVSVRKPERRFLI